MNGVDPETVIPRTQREFRADQVAKHFAVSVAHIWNLIKQGEIVVPQERIASAPSRASILVPRASLVDFVSRRRNSPARLRAKAAAKARKAKRKRAQRGSP